MTKADKRIVDSQKFIRLATKRTNIVLKYLRLIANLGNKSNYSYTPEQVDQIFRAITEEIEITKKAFTAKQVKEFQL